MQSIIDMTAYALSAGSDEQLRISRDGNRVKYYIVSRQSDCNETEYIHRHEKYLGKKNRYHASEIAQIDYDRKLCKIAQNQIKAIHLAQHAFDYDVEKLYEKMNPIRQQLINPRIITDNMFVDSWLVFHYVKRGFTEGTPEIYTNRGKRVRSKSEKIIADMLDYYKVPYRYECPLVLKYLDTVYPNFTVLCIGRRKEIYWEHLGMMDNVEYCEKALFRISCFKRSGYMLGNNLLISYESSKYVISTDTIKRKIEYILSM